VASRWTDGRDRFDGEPSFELATAAAPAAVFFGAFACANALTHRE